MGARATDPQGGRLDPTGGPAGQAGPVRRGRPRLLDGQQRSATRPGPRPRCSWRAARRPSPRTCSSVSLRRPTRPQQSCVVPLLAHPDRRRSWPAATDAGATIARPGGVRGGHPSRRTPAHWLALGAAGRRPAQRAMPAEWLREALDGFTSAQLPLEAAHCAGSTWPGPSARPTLEVAVAEARAALQAFERLEAARYVDAAADGAAPSSAQQVAPPGPPVSS